jgi:hypothetical protein
LKANIVATRRKHSKFAAMDKTRLSESPTGKWTQADDYVAALARRRSARLGREPKRRRSQPEIPRFVLSTLPYLALISACAILTVAIAVAAFPGLQPVARTPQLAERQQGVAAKGWFEDAQREFHR